MDGSVKDLSIYRYERAEKELKTAGELLHGDNIAASVNRSYYAVFHLLRAVTALDGFDSRKHSGIIAYFNRISILFQLSRLRNSIRTPKKLWRR